VCVDIGVRFKKADETIERLFAVAAWKDAPCFTDAERAALGLTEAVTRLSDCSDPVPDEIWKEAARHYDESALASLVLWIATMNVWNRLNVASAQVAGEWANRTKQEKRMEEKTGSCGLGEKRSVFFLFPHLHFQFALGLSRNCRTDNLATSGAL